MWWRKHVATCVMAIELLNEKNLRTVNEIHAQSTTGCPRHYFGTEIGINIRLETIHIKPTIQNPLPCAVSKRKIIVKMIPPKLPNEPTMPDITPYIQKSVDQGEPIKREWPCSTHVVVRVTMRDKSIVCPVPHFGEYERHSKYTHQCGH